MSKIFAIAFNTFKEAVRNRILYILLVFALLIMASSGIVGELTISARDRVIKDLGTASISFFGLLIAIFVGIGLVYNELDKKTIYTIVTKPIDRHQFLIGKYLGLLLTIYVNILIMTFFFLAVMYYQQYMSDETVTRSLWTQLPDGEWISPTFFTYFLYYVKSVIISGARGLGTLILVYRADATADILPLVFYSCLEMAIITAFAILYSSFSTPTLSALLTILTFIIGRLNADIIIFADRLKGKGLTTLANKIKYDFAWLAAHVTPNLWLFNRRTSLAVDTVEVRIEPYPIIYGILYSVAVIYLAVHIFRRRNFK
jgi:ABC-type transport system involved in multi-copper enzyme maturation permease subunit